MGSGASITEDRMEFRKRTLERLNSKIKCFKELENFAPIFSAIHYKGSQYLITVTPKFHEKSTSLVFQITDTKLDFFHHEFGFEDIFEMREAMDVTCAISWNVFFASINRAFYSKNVRLKIDGDGSCRIKIDLSYRRIGRTCLTLKLRKYKPKNQLKNYFVLPMISFFNKNEDSPKELKKFKKIESMISEIRDYSTKINLLESNYIRNFELSRQNTQFNQISTETKKQSSNVQNTISSIVLEFTNGEELLRVKNTEVMDNLKAIKELQNKKDKISEEEEEAYKIIMQVLEKKSHVLGLNNNDVLSESAEKLKQDEEVDGFLKTIRKGYKKKKGSGSKTTSNKNYLNAGINEEMAGVDAFLESSMIRGSKVKDDIMKMFKRVDDWNFDVFTLDKITGGQTLFLTGYTLFMKYDLLNKFEIKENILINFLREVQSGYHKNPYHNSMHAADVAQVLHAIIHKGGLQRFMTDEDIFAALFAAIVHDLDHPGLNNAFQTNSKSYLAILYNDRSVLENHHVSQAFELVDSEQYNIFEKISSSKRKHIRETIISMIIATDMQLHNEIFGEFKARNELGEMKIIDNLSKKEGIRLCLRISIKMADVSNPARPTHIYLEWAKRLCVELYNQGDRERELNLKISPLMDRRLPTVQTGQKAFIQHIIDPMYSAFAELLPKMRFCLKYISKNRSYWEKFDSVSDEIIEQERVKELKRIERRELKKKNRNKRKVSNLSFRSVSTIADDDQFSNLGRDSFKVNI